MIQQSKYNPEKHHRRSVRQQGYNYLQNGLYFVTICCQDRNCLFGKIINGKMVLNDAGRIANTCWLDIPKHFPHAVLHEYVIMPNHVHGIIELTDAVMMETVGAKKFSPLPPTQSPTPPLLPSSSSQFRSPSKTIGSIVRGFKIGVTKWMRQNTDVFSVWQRNYYENIIRNEQSYNNIVNYITNNPSDWQIDNFYK